MASKNKPLPLVGLNPRHDTNKEVTESAGGAESASSTKVLRLLGLDEMPSSMNFLESENTVSSMTPAPGSPLRKNDRKSTRIRSTNVLRMFKMPDGMSTKAPGATDFFSAMPLSPTADFSESLIPLDTAPPTSGGSSGELDSQSEQSPTIVSSKSDGDGRIWSMVMKLKLRNSATGLRSRSASTGTAPPSIDLSVLEPAVMLPLAPLIGLTKFKENDTDFAPSADSVTSTARLLPIQATPEGGSDVELSARPLPSDAVIPATSDSNNATKRLSKASTISPSQNAYPLRRSSIKPYGSFPIQRPSASDGASRPALQRSRSRSQPSIMQPTMLNTIVDDEASMTTKHTPTSDLKSPGHPPGTVAPRRQSVDSSSRHDMSVLLQQLSLLESRLLADRAPDKPTVLEPTLEDLKAKDITAEPFNTKTANESVKALPDLPKTPGDHVAQTPKGEQKPQPALPSVPVEFSNENTTKRLPHRLHMPLSSQPALQVPHVATEPPVTPPKEALVQQGNPWDDVLEIYGPGGDDEKQQLPSPAKSSDGLSDIHVDIKPIPPAKDDIKMVENVYDPSLEGERKSAQIPQADVLGTFADKKSDLSTPQVPVTSLSTSNNPPLVSEAVFVAQCLQINDLAPENLTENASVAHSDSGLDLMDKQVAGLTVSPALVPSHRLVRESGDGLVLTELLPRPADGFAGMPPGLEDMSREELVDHIRDLTRALAWSESCLKARNQEVERLWTELELLRNKNETSTKT